MAMTGLPRVRSSAAAWATKLRLVPTWTMASTSGPSISSMTSAIRDGPTSAIDVAVAQRRPVMAATSKPASVK